jgi:hypothetical protein
MVLTLWGYLLLALAGLATGLFCWLSYSSLTDAARPGNAAQDDFLARAARDITGAISPGS